MRHSDSVGARASASQLARLANRVQLHLALCGSFDRIPSGEQESEVRRKIWTQFITIKPGHMLVHAIQATRGAKVTVHGKTYTGIPVESCAVCHNRSKRIGVSFQGLMESAFESPYTEGGGGQLPLHTKHYIAMQEDVHAQKGTLCQDCHTSNDMHSDGFLACTNLASVEIECSDCHGTPAAYPWELSLGYMDEFDDPPKKGAPRGTAKRLYSPLEQGTVNLVEDGYLITARGNPLPGSVRRGNRVIVHAAGGQGHRTEAAQAAPRAESPVDGGEAGHEHDQHAYEQDGVLCVS